MPGFYLRASGKTEGGAETEGVSPMTVSLEDLHAEALALLDGVPEGPELDMRTSALIELAVRAAVTALDVDGIRTATGLALDAGATADQIHETLVLVSGLGVHSPRLLIR
jgi:alkylhydroperoxidase/carboxymuconolactone decarboxylase family protein YurZ